jgi:hypothetical protein
VVANIAEGYRKRRYPNMFISMLADADAEATEVQVGSTLREIAVTSRASVAINWLLDTKTWARCCLV